MLHTGRSRRHLQNQQAWKARLWGMVSVLTGLPGSFVKTRALCPGCLAAGSQPVTRVFSGSSKKLIKAAAEKTARDWFFWSCIDAQSELESMVVMLVSIQFDRSGGNPKII